MPTGLFSGYAHEGWFDETFESGDGPRAHYLPLVQRLEELADELERRERLGDAAFRNQGITFTVYGEEGEEAGGVDARSRWTSSRESSQPPSGRTSSAASSSA